MRRSLSARRDEAAFRAEQQRLVRLHQHEAEGALEVFYFDETGLSLTPVVPYAWQHPRAPQTVPSSRSSRVNVLGFMSRTNQSFFQTVIGTVSSAEVIAAFDAFAQQTQTAGVIRFVILDNASIHHSEAFRDRLDTWLGQGLAIHYLPPYSPELNRIEILWRKLKYEWLPLSAYTSFAALKSALNSVLEQFGPKYRITFV